MSDATTVAMAALAPLAARLTADVLEGKYGTPRDAARAIVGLGLTLVPREELIAYLTEEGREAGELAADIAETTKFGP